MSCAVATQQFALPGLPLALSQAAQAQAQAAQAAQAAHAALALQQLVNMPLGGMLLAQQQQAPTRNAKTRLCWHFDRGYCRFGATCSFAHGAAELSSSVSGGATPAVAPAAATPPPVAARPPPPAAPLVTGPTTPPMSSPAPSVGGSSPRQDAPALKTALCRHFAQGHCKYESGCSFAHGAAELRSATTTSPPRDASPAAADLLLASPDAKVKTRLCRHFERGYCRFGATCSFAHGTAELRSCPLGAGGDDEEAPADDGSPRPVAPSSCQMVAVMKDADGGVGATLRGTVVVKVRPGGAMDCAGVRAGQRVVSINGRAMSSLQEVKEALAIAGAAFTATVADQPGLDNVSVDGSGSDEGGTVGPSDGSDRAPTPPADADARPPAQ